jgi:hypothetical protein
MIIFDLDGTIADCEHRRHFVDWHKTNYSLPLYKWKPDWKSFYEACDKDNPNYCVIKLLNQLLQDDFDIQIWSGRCESVKSKTISWLKNYLDVDAWFYRDCLKMRPIGDSTPDDILKEKWLDEILAKGEKIEFVFDDRPKVVRMWRRKGIFIFNCCQHDEEF